MIGFSKTNLLLQYFYNYLLLLLLCCLINVYALLRGL
jgi:hypothetical protein